MPKKRSNDAIQPWVQRLQLDVEAVYHHMRNQRDRHQRLAGFSIQELAEALPDEDRRNRGRERIYGALAWLLKEGRVTVEGQSADRTKFYVTR
jgi:hypothetical protein